MHITYTMKRPKQEGRKVGEGGEERGERQGVGKKDYGEERNKEMKDISKNSCKLWKISAGELD